jgi:hypothetical protein
MTAFSSLDPINKKSSSSSMQEIGYGLIQTSSASELNDGSKVIYLSSVNTLSLVVVVLRGARTAEFGQARMG